MASESLAAPKVRPYMQAMQVKLLAFAQIRQQLGFSELCVECGATETPRAIISRIAPSLDVTCIRVAIDHEYCAWDAPIGEGRELALIPPVSGG
jgi:molybdopterin converting factor small subunit